MLSNDDINESLSLVRRELQRYVPSYQELSISRSPTAAHVLEDWARYLKDSSWWNYPISRPWPAPTVYEQAFNGASGRNKFLFALRRLLDAIEPILSIPDEDNPLFREDNQMLSEAKREEMRRFGLHRARIITKRMGSWLQLREKPADEQFLEALKRILLVSYRDYRLMRPPRPTDKLTVVDYHSDSEAELHLDFLLTRLRENMPRDSTTLNTFRRRVEQFLDNPLAKLTGAGFDVELIIHGFEGLYKALVDQFPQYTFVDGVSGIPDQRVSQFAENFWSRFAYTISDRMRWANRALNLVEDIIEKPGANNKPQETVSELNSVQLSLRQIALLQIYQGKPIQDIDRAKVLAKENGYKSGEALLKKSNEFRSQTDRIGVDGRRVNSMIKDIEAIIPLLDGAKRLNAESELNTIKTKR